MMNSFLRRLVLLSLSGLLNLGLAHADDRATPPAPVLASANYPAGTNNNPDNSAIRRANPNSRQGTESISPNMRGAVPRAGQQPPPTLENGGIGNGYPARQQSPRPSSGAQDRSN